MAEQRNDDVPFPEPPEGLVKPEHDSVVEWMSDEKRIPFWARDYLAAGGLVMSVSSDEEEKATAARILGDHGGHGMAHFGRNHWEPLGS